MSDNVEGVPQPPLLARKRIEMSELTVAIDVTDHGTAVTIARRDGRDVHILVDHYTRIGDDWSTSFDSDAVNPAPPSEGEA
jgi:hypothetical protein